MRYFWVNIFLLFFSCTLFAGVYSSKDVTMVHLQDKSRYVCNPDDIILSDSVYVMDALLADLEQSTGIETAVVVVEKIEDGDCFNFAFNIGQQNGIGKSSSDNGLVIVLSTEDRCVQFVTGYGLEGILPDALCKRIQVNYMNGYFSEGEWSKGLASGVRVTSSILKGTWDGEIENEDEVNIYSELMPYFLFFGLVLIFFLWVEWESRRCPSCKKHKLKRLSRKLEKRTSSYSEYLATYECSNCGMIVNKQERTYHSDGAKSVGGGFGGALGGGSRHRGGSFGGGSFGGGGAGSRF